MITQKNQDRLLRQQEFRETTFIGEEKREILVSLDKLIDRKSKIRDTLKETTQEPEMITFGNYTFPLAVWKTTYNLELHRYSMILMRINYLRQALLNDELTNQQIDDIIYKKKYVKYITKTKHL